MHYLLGISIGPVQDFIAAARRTRDLWFGSWILSEISKAAASSLANDGCVLIFPDKGSDLKERSALNVANRIVGEMTAEGKIVVKALNNAEEAARKRLKSLADSVYAKQEMKQKKVDRAEWDEQIESLLEIYCVATPVKDGFAKAMKRMDGLLAARKATRDFKPESSKEQGKIKSSLDGRRIAVTNCFTPEQRKIFRIAENEALSAVDLVKRLGGDPEQYTPLSRLAADPWIQANPEIVTKLQEPFEQFVKAKGATRVKGNKKDGGKSIYDAFPYDGQLLYTDRHARAAKDVEEGRFNIDAELEKVAKDVGKGPPQPYLAVLLADGDRMGEYLSKQKIVDDMRNAGEILSGFAASAHTTIREHRGHCIYAGGDDVLAMLPLPGALGCAQELYDNFGKLWGADNKKTPTLSVGLTIVHFMTPMGQILQLAREAEKLAKGEPQERDGLGIILATRGGAPLSYRSFWKNKPVSELAYWQKSFADRRVPTKLAYELDRLQRRLGWQDDAQHSTFESMLLKGEIKRILEKKESDRGGEASTSSADLAKMQTAITDRGFGQVIRELLIASHLQNWSVKNQDQTEEVAHG